jgi:hypothetical protein
LKDGKAMNDLSGASTADLTRELICRVIEGERGAVAPILGLIRLATHHATLIALPVRSVIAPMKSKRVNWFRETPMPDAINNNKRTSNLSWAGPVTAVDPRLL